jgi:hypothetical protein
MRDARVKVKHWRSEGLAEGDVLVLLQLERYRPSERVPDDAIDRLAVRDELVVGLAGIVIHFDDV